MLLYKSTRDFEVATLNSLRGATNSVCLLIIWKVIHYAQFRYVYNYIHDFYILCATLIISEAHTKQEIMYGLNKGSVDLLLFA